LDLTACAVAANTAGAYDLTVSEASNTSSIRYTAACKASIREQGPCSVERIKDNGFAAAPLELAFAVLGVFFELISGYQIVRYPSLISFASVVRLISSYNID
jgi:hypothetical protein